MSTSVPRAGCDQLRLAAAKVVLELISAEILPDIATEALVAGCDSLSLRLLAGLTQVEAEEARTLLKKALLELHLSIPDARQAVSLLARDVARDILQGTSSPYEGAKEISDLSLLVAPDHHLPDLDTFVYAASEWKDRPNDRNIFVEGILAAARDLVQSGPDPAVI